MAVERGEETSAPLLRPSIEVYISRVFVDDNKHIHDSPEQQCQREMCRPGGDGRSVGHDMKERSKDGLLKNPIAVSMIGR